MVICYRSNRNVGDATASKSWASTGVTSQGPQSLCEGNPIPAGRTLGREWVSMALVGQEGCPQGQCLSWTFLQERAALWIHAPKPPANPDTGSELS